MRRFAGPGGDPVVAVAGVDLAVDSGSAVALMGPSGSGKSTLLHLLGGLLRPDAGRVMVGDVDVGRLTGNAAAAYPREVGFVFQRFQLLPALSAVNNVLAPSLPFRPSAQLRGRARSALATVGLVDEVDAVPSMLSGGEQQRVAVARAVFGAPRLVLADEPTGNLDSVTVQGIIDLLLDCGQKLVRR
ncbi:MAG: ABC transporter ATP-binding protein [Mycobacteriales bacterium]|nr:MAG: ABC transporter [Pseudonocardiales bacterium]